MSKSELDESGPSPVPEQIVEHRTGSVLLKDTILKSDHFPGCHNTKLKPHLEGCPNYRQVDGLPVFGVAVPTGHGLRVMMDKLAADLPLGTTVYWNNMREEPLIYISGRPFVVRERRNPFMNLEYTGITKDRVEDMEDRLRQDILNEAADFDDQILVADEDDSFNVFDMMLRVSEADVQTPKSMFTELQAEGYNVVYNRIPITDEKAPKPTDFDYLLQQVYSASYPAAFVFNCQMGRGRTTTGMVITSMALLKRQGVLNRALAQPATGRGPTAAAEPAPPDTGAAAAEPVWFKEGLERSLQSQAAAVSDRADATAMMRAGHLLVVRSLLRVLPNSTHAKAALDAVVDACAAMQNLRSIIVRYRGNMLKEPREDKRAKILSVVTDHIDRYCHLIVFCSYLSAPAVGDDGGRQPFAAFLGALPEVKSVMERLLWAFPMLTLELDGESGRDMMTHSEKVLEELSDVLAQRNGAVLCASTILKADNYPSLQSTRLPQPIDGAPNFRQAAAGLPVFGAGISTLLGVQRVLQATGSGPVATAARAAEQRQTVWHNLREEPVLFLNGTPYVLREAAGAYTNMKEYSGIDAARLEALEERLRAEVLQEAAALGGKVQVLYEEMIHSGRSNEDKKRGRLQTGFEVVLDASGVMTPRQLFESLAKAGYGVSYLRVPITDGKVPGHDDVAHIHSSLAAAGPRSNFVFNCQQGKGRTTIGMAMASLFLSAQVWRERRKFAAVPGTTLHVASLPAPAQPASPRLSALAPRAAAEAPATAGSSSSDLEGDSDVEARAAEAAQPASPPHTALAPAGAVPPRSDSPACGPQPLRCFVPRGRGSVAPSGGPAPHSRAQVAFLGVRRLLGEIAEASVIVTWLDRALDACSHMVHLRDVVGSHRASRLPGSQLRPELSRLRQAFARDAVALARYCLLLVYAAYLHHNIGAKAAGRREPADAAQATRSKPFDAWVESLAAVKNALAAPLEDPVRALTPLPQTAGPPSRAATPLLEDENPDGSLPAETAAQVLAARRFRMLSPFTILKSFHQPDAFSATDAASGRDIPGLSDLYQVAGQPIWLASNPSVEGLRGLVECLGAKAGSRVVVVDTREELGVYLRGHPYTRRELEMPTASMHHAGIHWRELRKLERWLRDDVCSSSTYGADDGVHRVLVHKEAPVAPGAPAPRYSIEDATDVTLQQSTATHLTAHWVHMHAEELASVDHGIATSWQVMEQLRAEGGAVWYRRLPLSRNRTPDASDMDSLHRCAFAAAAGDDVGVGDSVKFVLVARAAATSTSTSFVAHFLGLVLAALAAHDSGRGEADGGGPAKARRIDGDAAAADPPQFSVLDNLCRVLDNGSQCREDVDASVRQLHSIAAGTARVYDVLDSIAACTAKAAAIQAQRTADAAGTFRKQQELSTARRLGAHYLMRYFLLIAFRAYFQHWLQQRGEGGAAVTFSAWFKGRKELGHLLRSCQV